MDRTPSNVTAGIWHESTQNHPNYINHPKYGRPRQVVFGIRGVEGDLPEECSFSGAGSDLTGPGPPGGT